MKINDIKIAKIIIQKRREKGITQEELAEYMGVSKAAVSKWEKEQSYPDITLLPHLAAYFNISIDELFNYSPQLDREEIMKLCLKLSADFTTKPYDEVMTEYREITKTYYSCFSLLFHVASVLLNYSMSVEADENRTELLNETIALLARVVSESGDPLLANDALRLQCFSYLRLKEYEEVFALLGDSLHVKSFAEDILISEAFIYAGNNEKAKEISQCGIYIHLLQLIASTTMYVSLNSDDSFETARTAHERLTKLIRLFNVEQIHPYDVGGAYLLGAELYCKYGDNEKAYEFLEKYAELCQLFFPVKLRGDEFFTTVERWLEDSEELGAAIPLDENIVKRRLVSSLDELPSLVVLHDEPRYKSIVRKITDFLSE